MEFNKSVSNPMLAGSIELVKAEDTPEHRNMFVTELTKAVLLSPAIVDPAPEEDDQGNYKPAPGSKVQFPMLSAPAGKRFFMAFTDRREYEAWQEKNQKMPYFALKFEEYAAMLLGRAPAGAGPAAGFVINPFGANIVVPREMVAGIMAARAAQAGHGTQMQGRPAGPSGPGGPGRPS